MSHRDFILDYPRAGVDSDLSLSAQGSIAMSSFEWKMRKFTDSDFELHVDRGESRHCPSHQCVPQAALVLSSPLGTPQHRARVFVPAVPSVGTAVPGLCVQGTTEALAMWKSV